jgi:hypothetical protein
MTAFVLIHGLLEEVRSGFGTEGTVLKAQSPVCRETRPVRSATFGVSSATDRPGAFLD